MTDGELSISGIRLPPHIGMVLALETPRAIQREDGVRRDIDAMLYWALRWHEGRQVPDAVLCDVLWGEFASKPKDPGSSLRELMTYVRKRHGDKWDFQDCGGKAFRILPRSEASVADFDRGRVRSGVGRASGRTS